MTHHLFSCCLYTTRHTSKVLFGDYGRWFNALLLERKEWHRWSFLRATLDKTEGLTGAHLPQHFVIFWENLRRKKLVVRKSQKKLWEAGSYWKTRCKKRNKHTPSPQNHWTVHTTLISGCRGSPGPGQTVTSESRGLQLAGRAPESGHSSSQHGSWASKAGDTTVPSSHVPGGGRPEQEPEPGTGLLTRRVVRVSVPLTRGPDEDEPKDEEETWTLKTSIPWTKKTLRGPLLFGHTYPASACPDSTSGSSVESEAPPGPSHKPPTGPEAATAAAAKPEAGAPRAGSASCSLRRRNRFLRTERPWLHAANVRERRRHLRAQRLWRQGDDVRRRRTFPEALGGPPTLVGCRGPEGTGVTVWLPTHLRLASAAGALCKRLAHESGFRRWGRPPNTLSTGSLLGLWAWASLLRLLLASDNLSEFCSLCVKSGTITHFRGCESTQGRGGHLPSQIVCCFI